MISGYQKPLMSQETDLEMRILCSGGLAFRKTSKCPAQVLPALFYFFVFRFRPFLSSAFLHPIMRGRRTG
jgi:hypothetical protein